MMLGGLGKSMTRSAWMVWERGIGWFISFRSLHTLHFGICTVMIKRHRGSSILCQDSTSIHNGDMVGELHLNNQAIVALLKTEGLDRTALQIARLARKSLMQISEAFEERPEFREVKAVVGITLLHRGLTHGLGFERQALKYGLFHRLTTAYLRLLLSAIHPDGQRRVARRTEALVPMMLIHTRASLKNRFLAGNRIGGAYE